MLSSLTRWKCWMEIGFDSDHLDTRMSFFLEMMQATFDHNHAFQMQKIEISSGSRIDPPAMYITKQREMDLLGT